MSLKGNSCHSARIGIDEIGSFTTPKLGVETK